MKFFENGDGLTEPRGFFCAGIHCDIKGKRDGKLDLGIVYSSKPCNAAAVFTTNDVKAAPVLYSQSLLLNKNAKFHAVIANSGNANACTGKQGLADSKKMGSETARHLKVREDEVLVCSTGRIGVTLPMSRITAGIRDASEDILGEFDGAKAFQEAILTSDTCTKSCSIKINTGRGEISIGGVVKGAGMIEPNMATMLAFIETNVSINKSNLKKYLNYCANLSFNAISVDGDMSTNDCVAFTSTNLVKIDLKNKNNEKKLLEYAADFFIKLSSKIVKDGEGATKIIKLNICNAKTKTLAQEISRKISNSFVQRESF